MTCSLQQYSSPSYSEGQDFTHKWKENTCMNGLFQKEERFVP